MPLDVASLPVELMKNSRKRSPAPSPDGVSAQSDATSIARSSSTIVTVTVHDLAEEQWEAEESKMSAAAVTVTLKTSSDSALESAQMTPPVMVCDEAPLLMTNALPEVEWV